MSIEILRQMMDVRFVGEGRYPFSKAASGIAQEARGLRAVREGVTEEFALS